MSMDIYIVFGCSGGGEHGSLQRLRAYLRWRISGNGLLGFVDDSFCVLGYCSGEYFLPNTVVYS